MMEQAKMVTNLKHTMEQSSAVQVASLHNLKKIARQHSLAKEDALQDAQRMRDELSIVVKKADCRVMRLEKVIQHLEQGQIDMDAREKERVQTMEVEQRGLAKERRKLEVDQAECVTQKANQEKQSESLTYHRGLNRRERQKLKTSHNKAIERITSKSAIDRAVWYAAVSFLFPVLTFDFVCRRHCKVD
jgi:hypothetical protein